MRKPSSTRRPARPARKTGRPHLVALAGGKDSRGNDRRARSFFSTIFVPLPRPLSSSGVRFVATASAVLMALIFGLVMLHILSAQASFRLEGLHERVDREEARYRKMRYDVASAESPSRIADAAKGLGMVSPEERRYIVSRWGPESESRKQVADSRTDGDEIKAVLSAGGR